ncbi:MAG: hypothetical protein ACOYZ8_18415 [Chloroflexota bacterium]
MSHRFASEPSPTQGLPSRARARFGMIVTLVGFFIFLVGAKPGWLGLDRTPVVGFVQIAVFLFGLGLICIGGYFGLAALWRGRARSIVADIGVRLVATGYVISVFTGMADIFGMGTQSLPRVPYFGPWQAVGVVAGQVVIAVGFLMFIPFTKFQAGEPVK